jgi:hypothetical protein
MGLGIVGKKQQQDNYISHTRSAAKPNQCWCLWDLRSRYHAIRHFGKTTTYGSIIDLWSHQLLKFQILS